MIIVTSYMFSSRCIRSIVFIEIHCEYVTFDRCIGLFALLQKDHLAKLSCFWNLFNLSSSARCIWAEKQKSACRNCLWISALLEMEMWRNCKNKRGHLSHLNHELFIERQKDKQISSQFSKDRFFWGQISLSCEEGNDWLWTLLDCMVHVADIGSDLPACEPMWMSMKSRFPILFGTKVAASMMSRYSAELSWTGAKITLWCYQNNH